MTRTEYNCETGESRIINQVCYKDADDKVHVLDEGEPADGMTAITDEEAIALNTG